MSRRVIGLGFANQARGDKSNNNAIGGIGARTRSVRNSIITRSTNCCDLSSDSDRNEIFISLEQTASQDGVTRNRGSFLNDNEELVLRFKIN